MFWKELLLIILILIYFNCIPLNIENFSILPEKKESNCMEGNFHPNCIPNSKIYHLGYFNFLPILEVKLKEGIKRFLLIKGKFHVLEEKNWEYVKCKSDFFEKRITYKNTPYSFVNNYFCKGKLINNSNSKEYYLFGKELGRGYYQYYLLRNKDYILQYAYKLPVRKVIKSGESIFVKNKISTIGPFIFTKKR